jgi:hypothetical protein
VTAEFFVRKPALEQLDDLGQAGIKVEFFGLAERLGSAAKQEPCHRVTR